MVEGRVEGHAPARGVRRAAVLLALAAFLAGFGVLTQVEPAFAASFTVNSTADTVDTSPGNGVCADGSGTCTLRAAIMEANALAGSDTITVPAGTYTLTRANAGDVNEDNNSTGDLDVNSSLTIQGAGSGATIIQAGTNNSNGIDKVFALDPFCTSPINVTIDSVTVRFGRNTQPSGAADFSFTGGGIDWCSAGAGGTFILSNSVISDNTNVNGYGGGLNIDTVSSPTTVNITNDTFSNNQTLSATQTATGGAINVFGDRPTANVTNSTFSGNRTTNPTSGGGAIYFRPTNQGALSVSGSTFSGNTAAGIGGAIATDSYSAATTISLQTSTFSGNSATNSFGGALDLNATVRNTTPFSLSQLTITGNTAGQSGGGIFVGNSNVAMSKSRIVGNSAPVGSGLQKSVDAATATVTDNWWGCSTGPSAAPCDTATLTAGPPGGTLNFTPWYRNQLTASAAPIVTNQSTGLTASFLTDSANTAVPVADLAQVIGRPVSWQATNGNLSSTQGTVQAGGTATGTVQATAAGTAVISAKVDNDKTTPVSSNVLSLTVQQASTTAAITNGASLSSTPSVTGQPVAVNYSVTGLFGNSPTAPTGNVTVSDGTDSCTASVAAGTCNLTFRTAGSETLTATYAGDGNFSASPASSSASHTVNKAGTTTSITSALPQPSVTGQVVTFDVGVAAVVPGAAVSPTTVTGTVTVSDGATHSCTATVTAGAGSCTIAFPSAAAYSVTATYFGDTNFNGSVSEAVSHTVNRADTTTTITSDTPDPSHADEAVTVSYTVAANAPGASTPTGTVTVSDGVDSCSGTAAAGQCTITLTTVGARQLTATYAGDSDFNGSTSVGLPHTVDAIDTTTSITSDAPDPSVVGQPVTVQYSVAPGAGTPTGNVTVSDGTVSCTATVTTGQCDITPTTAGPKSLTATYAGDSRHNGSTSATAAHQVDKADTTTAITGDLPDPSIVGRTVTVQYSVTPVAPGAGTPTGDVTVSDGTVSCTATVTTGQCDITPTTAGPKSLTATYAGDSGFNGSTAATEQHLVNSVISGTVTDPDGDPLEGAIISAFASSDSFVPSASTTAGSDGTYDLQLPAGTYAVAFASPVDGNYITQWSGNAVSRTAATPVTVTPSAGATGVDAQLALGGSIAGVVTNGDGSPVPDVWVLGYLDTDGFLGSVFAQTGADGTYVLHGAMGSYKVAFLQPADAGLAVEWFQNAATRDSATSVPVGTGSDVTGIDAQLENLGTLAGTVTDGLGNPVGGVTVSAWSLTDTWLPSGGTTVTAADGTYTLHVRPGTHKVLFSPPSSSGFAPRWFDDAPGRGTASPVDVISGTTSVADAELTAAGTFTGTVRDDHGDPIVGATVSAFLPGSSFASFKAVTAGDGTYTLSVFGPATYRIRFDSPGYIGTWSSPGPLSIAAGQTTSGIDASLSPTP